mmetsp:Transcript_7592/g.11258  ORF Transcript_7592/g.11258 Transcript_7592/m.11258 type:complete len:577 (-) Transcript_7592:471-2201(-)
MLSMESAGPTLDLSDYLRSALKTRSGVSAGDHVISNSSSSHADEDTCHNVQTPEGHQDWSPDSSPLVPDGKKRFSRRNSKENFSTVEEDVIKCISANIVVHIQESEKLDYFPPAEYEAFNQKNIPLNPSEYSLESVKSMFSTIHHDTQMEYECMVVALIYMERIPRITNREFRICMLNWKYVMFTCMLLASKVWDDFAMNNASFASIFEYDVRTVNALEMQLLLLFSFDIEISRKEYFSQDEAIKQLILAAKSKEASLGFDFSLTPRGAGRRHRRRRERDRESNTGCLCPSSPSSQSSGDWSSISEPILVRRAYTDGDLVSHTSVRESSLPKTVENDDETDTEMTKGESEDNQVDCGYTSDFATSNSTDSHDDISPSSDSIWKKSTIERRVMRALSVLTHFGSRPSSQIHVIDESEVLEHMPVNDRMNMFRVRSLSENASASNSRTALPPRHRVQSRGVACRRRQRIHALEQNPTLTTRSLSGTYALSEEDYMSATGATAEDLKPLCEEGSHVHLYEPDSFENHDASCSHQKDSDGIPRSSADMGNDCSDREDVLLLRTKPRPRRRNQSFYVERDG